MRLPLLLCALAACGDDGATLIPDAPAPTVDAADLHCPDPPPDPARQGARVLYLAMDGITLTKGACSDSRTNCTDLIKDDMVTIPQFLPNTLGREDFIATILRLARVRLAPYSIDIVTTRPTSGNYYLFVLGGDPATIIGTPGVLSLAPQICDHNNPNAVDLMFDRHFQGGAQGYATSLLSDLGAISGLGVTGTPGDCMCRVDGCDFDGTCTFSRDVATVPGPNCGWSVQDEPALLKEALGCR